MLRPQLLLTIDMLAARAADANKTSPVDANELGRAAHEFANAYAKIKDIEIHEKFHLQQNALPGEGPLSDNGLI